MVRILKDVQLYVPFVELVGPLSVVVAFLIKCNILVFFSFQLLLGICDLLL
jgi:hypothetical protein